MDFSSLLNKAQLEAVSSKAQYLRIVAGAGSGKTRVLTYRIAHLIVNEGIAPNRILAIAFTNKVATEMASRAVKLVEELTDHTPILKIMTFHSFCARFLRTEHEAFGYPAGFTIYDEDDQKKLVKAIASILGYKKSDEIVKNALSYIRKKKGRGIYPSDINLSNVFSAEEKEYVKFYQAYEERKRSGFGLDFDDLLLVASQILENNAAIREKWRSRFDHILVDEFQDVNDIQFNLLKLLAAPSTSVYVVGDPDQTIYTWRGANQKIIMDFDKTFAGAETVILNENYRSTSTILAAANKLIANNKKRIPKDLFTNQGEGEKIVSYAADTSQEEAEWVARKVGEIARNNRNKEGEPDYTKIAVLYRSSYVTRAFEQEFKDRGIPYRIYGGLRFYERMEVKDLLAYFNLMMNPLDNVAFERVCNAPRRGVGDTSIERLRNEAKAKGLSEYNYLLTFHDSDVETELPKKAQTALLAMIKKIEETKAKLRENLEAYSAVLRDFAKDIGYYDYIAGEEDLDEDRIGNVNALFDDINHYLSTHPESDFTEYLQNVSLLTSQDDMKGGNYVSFMTVHVAKGLEFDNVFVICLNEMVFPSGRSLMEDTSGDTIEEERRLAYVAFTRARKRLFLSCNKSYSYQTDSHQEPSRFFKEAGIVLPGNSYWSTDSWKTPFKKPGYERSTFSFKKKPHDEFGDGEAIDPFKKSQPASIRPVPAKKPAIVDNGIHDWKVGDICLHEKFGKGIVRKVLDGNIIVVDFEKEGTKTILGTHRLVSRISKGGEA